MPGSVAPFADERSQLLAYVAQQRLAMRATAFGLTDEEARLAPTAGALTIGGLLKHVTEVERSWMDNVLQRTRPVDEGAYDRGFTMGEDETLADLLADLDAAGRETEEIVVTIEDLGQAVPVPDAPWFPKDVEAWSVRWVLLHLVEEIARHAGHADIVRESIDGATGFELLAGLEGWPATPWLTPWSRKERVHAVA